MRRIFETFSDELGNFVNWIKSVLRYPLIFVLVLSPVWIVDTYLGFNSVGITILVLFYLLLSTMLSSGEADNDLPGSKRFLVRLIQNFNITLTVVLSIIICLSLMVYTVFPLFESSIQWLRHGVFDYSELDVFPSVLDFLIRYNIDLNLTWVGFRKLLDFIPLDILTLLLFLIVQTYVITPLEAIREKVFRIHIEKELEIDTNDND